MPMPMPMPDRQIAAFARTQHGLFTTGQAIAVGFSPDQIGHRVASGRWERVMRGVLRLGGTADTDRQRAMAVTLARPDGATSHVSAAHLHGVGPPGPRRPVATVPRGTSGRSPIATLHRLALPAEAVTLVDGIRVTDVARTVVDCATVLGPHRLRGLLDLVLQQRATTIVQVERALATAPHLTLGQGRRVLEVLEVWRPSIRPGSVPEARLLRQIAEWELPPPSRQIRIENAHGTVIGRADVGWPDVRLGLEYDGLAWHGPSRWADDEARHAAIEAVGWRLLHVDKGDLTPGSDLRIRLTAAYAAAAAALR